MREFWDDIDVAELRRLFAAGQSDNVIANAVGKSKNAVIGQRNRMGMQRYRKKQAAAATPPAPKIERPEPPADGVGLLDLRWWMCQSVRLKVGPDNYPTYCGRRKTVVVNGDRIKLSPYCRMHHDLYHQPNQYRKHHGEISEGGDEQL